MSTVRQALGMDGVSAAVPRRQAQQTVRSARQLRTRRVVAELKAHEFNMTEDRAAIGLERSHLYKKCQQLGIDVKTIRE